MDARDLDVDRLHECRALGALAGMTSAGVGFGAYFMNQLFKATEGVEFFVVDLIAGCLVVGMLGFFLGGSGLVGRWIGEHVVYPLRTGNNRAGTKWMYGLMLGGLALVSLVGILIMLLEHMAG